MPTLEGHLDDLNSLLPAPLSPEDMNQVLDRVKGEWKHFDPATRRFKIELNDTNRPDLWSVEGIARQLRGGIPLPGRPYSFLERAAKRERGTVPDISVDPGLSAVRPFLGGFRATGGTLGEEGLAGLIGTQERLSELFGRKRADLAIGVYPLKGRKEISFPLSFRLADPDVTRFVPLGEEGLRSLREVVATHPKGIAYGSLVSYHSAWPVLADAQGEILSLPPVINSQTSGAVVAGDRDLFVEATGNDPQRILLALNILAANLTDRGFHVDPLLSKGEGWDLLAPASPGISVFVPAGLPARVLGCGTDPQDFIEVLLGFGYPALSRKGKGTKGEGGSGEGFEVLQPFYRDDLLGAVDVVEDYLVARGFESFAPVMPRAFTAGSKAPRITVENRIRTAFLGMGFTELLSNILTGEPAVTARLGRAGDLLVRIDNPASLHYAVVRPTLLSGLLAAESRSARHPYPHRLFEAGEAMELSPLPSGDRGLRDLHLAAALVSHPQAGISELQGVLDALLARFDQRLVLEATDLPPYIPGRCGVLKNSRGERIATVGEIHPATLDLWGIRMPTAAFEIDIGALLAEEAQGDSPHSGDDP